MLVDYGLITGSKNVNSDDYEWVKMVNFMHQKIFTKWPKTSTSHSWIIPSQYHRATYEVAHCLTILNQIK